MTGGKDAKAEAKCEWYDLRGTNKWTKGPDMNFSRFNHSSCVNKGTVYVFGGYDATRGKCGSIECLNAIDIVCFGRRVEWVPIGRTSTIARVHALFAPITNHEVAVMGGAAQEFMGDVQVIDTQTKRLTCVQSQLQRESMEKRKSNDFIFIHQGNQHGFTVSGKLIALVLDQNFHEHLISYK